MSQYGFSRVNFRNETRYNRDNRMKETFDMIGNLGPTELILILAIVTLLFGVGRISRVGGEMGSAVRAFREGLKGDGEENDKSEKAS